VWTYQSPFGRFCISYEDKDGLPAWKLTIDAEYLGRYHSPHAAADEVSTRTTGKTEWDMYSGKVPSDLDDWTEEEN
jgi:hypothetical protein